MSYVRTRVVLVGSRLVLILHERCRRLQVGLNHLLHERLEIHLALPSKQALGFGRVSEQKPKKLNQHKVCQSCIVGRTYSTSAGRKYRVSTLTSTLPVFAS